jgi:NADPH:quinone reductase-like Zn-dependent oxidoreductase
VKVWQLTGDFGRDHLQLVDRPEPVPGPGEVRLRVGAFSLNHRDNGIIRGEYNPKLQLPRVLVSDGVGEVTGVGEGVERVRPGERVMPMATRHWVAGAPERRALRSTRGADLDGMAAEQVLVAEEDCVHVPAHLTDEEAAALPCAALTAWSAMVTQGGLTAGQTVLVQGSGGVSVFALQIARMLGARVLATSSKNAKLERLHSMGASDVINYDSDPAWGETAKRLSGGGVDLVVDVGGASTLPQSFRAVRPGGAISLIGVLGGGRRELDLTPLLMRNVRIQGVFLGHRQAFEALCRAVELHGMRPVIDRVFDFGELPNALDHLASGRHFGKVCLRTAAGC